MAYSKNAQKRYDEKCKNVTIRYNQSDMSVYNILNKYLTDNNISFNGYFKQLALNDLKSKGLIESEWIFMSYSKNAQKKYMEKCKTYAVKYTPVDMSINNVLEKYLSENNISFNSYAKQLIRNDLISKGLIKES